ncbi:hypothetical protein VC83_02306 [Pseudogymnoascus destructans]|uniref:sn-1-specific diacylglycerol lipase n=2 Tax=Pseudogymnoascus destructans TaxID=655981 RepID=L8FRK4_PSED2|nr:uncharacterized protein VC83_02306 [Pseudogymnoascus destructans]ELR03184.1 hypothetical protein GMDG_01167 [Pseudogymnoascus destructans 20631-21]OAF61073.1 hypothetical protein VC83_02306 [Pseudogymnoascus destructans]
MKKDEDEAASRLAANIPRIEDASTVLPKPVASAISLVTKSSALYLRLGTLVGKLAIDGARVTTVTGLELSRAVVERILFSAGEDVVKNSTGQIGRQEAEGLLERSIARLHSTITHISFAASAGFHLSSAGLSAASDVSQHLLITLDSIFGSTDSSRAIASIITLVRREFQNPATGQPGEKVGVVDLLVGVCGLALLQQWCKKSSEQEAQDGHYKDIVWDVVILDDGSPADTGEPWLITAADVGQGMQENNTRDLAVEDDGDGPEARLRERIMQSLPPDATVSITTETTTTKVTTVEISGAQPLDLLPPPGAEVIEENAHHFDNGNFADSQNVSHPQSRYRVVYRTVHNKIRGTDVLAKDGPDTSFTQAKVEELPDTRADMDWQPEDVEPLLSEHLPSNTANSKRARQSHSTSSHQTRGGSSCPSTRTSDSTSKMPMAKKAKVDTPNKKGTEKRGTLRDALRKGPQATISNILGKDTQVAATSYSTKPIPPWQMSGVAGSSKRPESKPARPPHLPVPDRNSSNMRTGSVPLVAKSTSPRPLDEVQYNHPKPHSRSHSRASYYEVHERRRDSIVSQTDTYSVHSTDTSRASSPTQLRSHIRNQSNLMRTRSSKDLNIIPSSYQRHSKTPEPSPLFAHRSTNSYDPSIYTLKTNNSETSLVLTHLSKGAFDDEESVQLLRRNGSVPGLYPRNHLVQNISRFARFASASYGSNFMRLMGISATPTSSSAIPDSSHHYEHHSFSSHTQLPSSTILLSSFVDPQGGTDSAGKTGTSVPLVHFISLDHESQAVVLSCRGTLGFEDVLTDMTCDYDDMHLRDRSYRVHKGIHASARRLISGAESRVLATIAAALEEFPTYGLVMCGHSLGGSVVSLLAIMLATPGSDPEHNAFVTTTGPPQSGLPHTSSPNTTNASPQAISLPAGRPIHVYAYGPPATLSPSLRGLTRGLITTIVNKNDLVPSLSLGVLHDIQAVALAFKADSTGAASRVRARVWNSLSSGLMEQWYRGDYVHGTGPSEEDDQWAWATLKTLRASMQSEKLVPPGEVFQVETTAVLRRDAFTVDGKYGLGRPATRAVLRYVRDVEAVFGEVQFGGGMLGDHSPGRYENSLKALGKGVLGGLR